ncbi:MAG: YDG domain-containing protein [Lachnospiraceae bacterium]
MGKKISEGTGLKIKDSEIKDAGTYEVHLLGTGNYDNSTNSATFTIQKSTLFLMINGNVKKVYDGTVGVTDAQNLAIQLATTKEGINPFDKIYVDHVEWEYNYADAGKRVLTAHDIKIAGPNVENYQLESTSEVIMVGLRNEISHP